MTDDASGSVADTVAHLWRRIEAALQATQSPILQTLAPGASEEAIAQAEAVIGLALPEDVRASYRIHDGGIRMQLVSGMRLLSLAEAAEWWRVLEELLHDESWISQPPYYFSEDVIRQGGHPGPIRPIWWDARWIPFAQDYGGNLTCLDMAPEPGGTVGHIIDWDHECGPSRILYPDFTALLSALAEQLETGGPSNE